MYTKARAVAALAAVLGGSGALALLPAASSASSTPTSSPITAAQTASLSLAEKALLFSTRSKTIMMNPQTGDIVSVKAGSAISPNIADHNICNSGDGCYDTNKVPYSDEGFYGGAGTAYGTWHYRSAYYSGKWTVSVCWTTRCGPTIGPNTVVGFTTDVTGTSFTIH